MIIEIVVFNIESAINAQSGGADRIELCDNPAEGGTTPSIGIIELVRNKLEIEVYVMIRPRGGDFRYSTDEIESMKYDIQACKELGVDGVVFGVLKDNGTIDKERCTELLAEARPMQVTCHRAFDLTPDPFKALEDCIEVGFDRILTSGQQPSAPIGAKLIGDLVKKAAGRILIMPGSGVNEKNVAALVKDTQVQEVHFSARKFVSTTAQHSNSIRFIDPLPEGAGNWIADTDTIRRIRSILK